MDRSQEGWKRKDQMGVQVSSGRPGEWMLRVWNKDLKVAIERNGRIKSYFGERVDPLFDLKC